MLPSHVWSNCYNTYLPLTSQPFPPVLTLYSLSYPQALNQHLTKLTHQRRSVQRALKVHQSQHQQRVTLTVSQAVSDSPHNACSAGSTTSKRVLWPRLPITYNEEGLSWLHRRPQVRTLHNMSIPLPFSDEESPSSSDSDEQESPTAEADANSPHSTEELSPVSRPEAGLPLQPKGGVTTWANARPSLQTRGGVTSNSDIRLPAEGSPTMQK